jgi:hypothetical protein
VGQERERVTGADLVLTFECAADAAAVAAAGAKSGRAVAAGTKAGASSAEKEYAKLTRAADRWHRDAVKSAERASQSEAKAAEKASRDKIRAAEKYTQARQRENDKIVRDAERTEQRAAAAAQHGASARARAQERSAATAQRSQSRMLSGAAMALAGGVFGLGKSVAGIGLGAVKGAVGGMGVDLDYESLVSKGVGLEKNSVDLVNAGYMPGHGGANGSRQSADEVKSQVRDVSMRTGNDSTDTMHGLQAFVAKTGDLETGRAVLFDLAKLSKATGANMGDMADAAGDVANELGDIPNKGAAIQSVMGAIAAQGKEGAVEIKDLARQMAKLGAAATQFGGDPAQSIANMGALVQMTRAKGGAASSTQAATSVMSFTQTFSKGARRKAFDEAGVNVEGPDGKLRNSRDIIIDALAATKGDTVKMGKMFADAGARRVTRGFETTYKDAGGGAAGLEAVRKAFDDLAGAVINNKEVEDSFALAMGTTEAQAKVFNEQLGAIADESRANLLPALKALAPALLSGSKAVADWIGDFTGKTRNDVNAKSDAAMSSAAGATRTLNEDLASGRMGPGDTEAAAKAKLSLQEAIALKKQEIAKERENIGQNGTLSAAATLDGLSPEEAKKKADEFGNEAKDYVRDKQQLENMENALSNLDQTLQDAMTRSLEGSVVTVRLNDPIVIATPSLSTPSAGVERPAAGRETERR